MAIDIINENQVAINSILYPIRGQVHSQYLPRQAPKINTGPAGWDKEQFLSHWILNDLRGGILVEEMDESIHSDRVWWTNCIIDWKGNITLPRRPVAVSKPTHTASAYNQATNWRDPDSAWTNEGNINDDDDDTYATASGIGSTSWSSYVYLDLPAISCSKVQVKWNIVGGGGGSDQVDVDLYYDSAWNDLYSGTSGKGSLYEASIGSTKTVYGARVRIYNGGGSSEDGALYTLEFYAESATAQGTFKKFINFNGELYFAQGNWLAKLDSGRTTASFVNAFPVDITDIIVSLNGKLYIYLGDSTNYFYMTTAEAITQSDSANAYWGFQWDDKLFKVNSSGAGDYSTDPDGAAPTWTGDYDITDVASDIETFFIGKDADGDDVPYCKTSTKIKVLDFTNSKWIDIALELPDYPRAGDACYWHNGHFFSYGLGVKKYVAGSTATITEVGLDQDDGLPVEYNGEITKLLGDTASNVMFALVDASATSGNSNSGVYAYNGRGWTCWWKSGSTNEVMYDAIVSSAESGYALYWAFADNIYFTDIHRGISNPRQLAGTQEYDTAGILITANFDANNSAYKKLIKKLITYTKSITSDETIAIKYRTNRTNIDADTGWTTLETLNTTGESGENEELFASGAGTACNSIQFRLDFARGSTVTNTPILHALSLGYRLITNGNWAYSFEVVCDDSMGSTAKQKEDNLITAIELNTLVPFVYRGSTTKYVLLSDTRGQHPTGSHYEGVWQLQAVEV